MKNAQFKHGQIALLNLICCNVQFVLKKFLFSLKNVHTVFDGSGQSRQCGCYNQ